MANQQRGEFTLTVGETRYKLKMTTDAMAEVEDLTGGKTWDEAIERPLQKGSVRALELLLWAALREFHPDIARDDLPKKAALKRMGAIIDQAGGLEGLWAQIKAFLELNMQEAARGAAGANPDETLPPAPPPDPLVRGTGGSSILTPVFSGSSPSGSGTSPSGNSGASSTPETDAPDVIMTGT